jgi:peptidoglycan/LPS O-acetylase OafA/YrhL
VKTERNISLDITRLIAAILVVLFHIFPSSTTGSDLLNPAVLAVDFFFVLSGFVLAPTIPDQWSLAQLWSWMKWRLNRLYSPLYPVLIFSLVLWQIEKKIESATGNRGDNSAFAINNLDYIYHSLLLQLFNENSLKFNIPLWSLSTEILMNFVFAVSILFMSKRKSEIYLFGVAFSYLIFQLWFSSESSSANSNEYIQGFMALNRGMLGLCLGLICFRYVKKIPILSIYISLGALLMCACLSYVLGFRVLLLFDLCCGLLIIYLWQKNPFLNFKPTKYSPGITSYEIYIWHAPWIIVITAISSKFLETESFLFLVFKFCMVMAMASLSGSLWRKFQKLENFAKIWRLIFSKFG